MNVELQVIYPPLTQVYTVVAPPLKTPRSDNVLTPTTLPGPVIGAEMEASMVEEWFKVQGISRDAAANENGLPVSEHRLRYFPRFAQVIVFVAVFLYLVLLPSL